MYLIILKQQREFRSKQLKNKRIYFLVVCLPKHDGIRLMVHKKIKHTHFGEMLMKQIYSYLRLYTCRLLNVSLQRQAIYFLRERSNNCEVKYLSVAKYWFTKTSNLFFQRKDQTIMRLHTCRLLNVGLHRQAIDFFKEKIKQL